MTDPQSWTVFRLPRSHWHCALDNFQWDAVRPASLQERLAAVMQQIADGGAPHLVMTGGPGIGKTHLGVVLYRQAAAVLGTELVTWLNVPDFCERVKQSYGGDQPSPWADVEAARRLVVLDDLFGRELTAHERSQVIVRLLDVIYQNNAALIVTMNPSVNELPVLLLPHEISRLLAGATVIPMTAAKDWRRG